MSEAIRDMIEDFRGFLRRGLCPMHEAPMEPTYNHDVYRCVGGPLDGAPVIIMHCPVPACGVRGNRAPYGESITLLPEFQFILQADTYADEEDGEIEDVAIKRTVVVVCQLIDEAIMAQSRISDLTAPRGTAAEAARQVIEQMGRASGRIERMQSIVDHQVLSAWRHSDIGFESVRQTASEAWLLRGFFMVMHDLQDAVDGLLVRPYPRIMLWQSRIRKEGHHAELSPLASKLVQVLGHAFIGQDPTIEATNMARFEPFWVSMTELNRAALDEAVVELAERGLVRLEDDILALRIGLN